MRIEIRNKTKTQQRTNSLELAICITFKHFLNENLIIIPGCSVADVTWPWYSIEAKECYLVVRKVKDFRIIISSGLINILSCLTKDLRECTVRKGSSERIKRSPCESASPLSPWWTGVTGDIIVWTFVPVVISCTKQEVRSLLEEKLPTLEKVCIAYLVTC